MEQTKNNKKSPSIYRLSEGRPGKQFSEEEYLALTSTLTKRNAGYNTKMTATFEDGYVLPFDSKSEARLVQRLRKDETVKHVRGQCVTFQYRYGGKDYSYTPDLVVYTKSKKIILIEVKELAMMNSRRNHRKYLALRKYCLAHGYCFLMCDSRLHVYGKKQEATMMPTIEKAILEAVKEKGEFNYEDYRALIHGKKKPRVNAIRDAVGTFLTRHPRYKMIGDMTFEITGFKIKKKAKRKKKERKENAA